MAMTRALIAAADPGYGADGMKRWPLTNRAECEAAWAHVTSPAAASEYTPAQLRRMKARIKAAGAEYGLSFDEKVTASKTLLNIELARPGTWRLASGEQTVTPQMLDDAARFASRDGARPGYLKIGHTDGRFVAGDGEPALGWLHNLRVEDDDGHVLKGDLHDVPDWLAAAIPKHWPDRSIEGWAGYEHEGEKYGLVVDGLALLGVTPPGMSSIKSLRDLPAALGVAASSGATRIVASFGGTPTPGSAPVAPTREGAGMDPAIMRQALGLPPDATDDEVKAGLVKAGLAPAAATDGALALDQRVAAAAASSGLITIDPAQLQEFRDAMVRASALTKRLETQDRDTTITAAVKAGKFPPVRRAHYENAWDIDPVGTKELIASLAAGLVPVTASGYDVGADRADDELDREIARLSQPSSQRTGV